ncbi:MAG: DUF262 domain-containing protein [Prevotellaceae bacterium]|nr:DUF262 domain-containing protein [Prevotellaceae bacterium]
MEENKLYYDLDDELKEQASECRESGLENEIDPEANELDINPFNPEDISIVTNQMAMDGLVRRFLQGSIVLNPDFQRNEVWDMKKRSQLIESLMLKIPLPMFYVQSDEDGILTVVDGLQRLSTIRDFVLGEDYLNLKKDDGTRREEFRGMGFKLKGLEFWSDYEGKQFYQLPPKLQNRILEAQVQVTVIHPTTPEVVRRNIFKRINTGGIQLNSQEIRNAIYAGPATNLLNELSNIDSFNKVMGNSVNRLRMQDKELILRFLSFLIRDYKEYTRTVTADMWLGDTMIILNAMQDLSQIDYRRLSNWRSKEPIKVRTMTKDRILQYFDKAMKRNYEIFGEHAFRKSFAGQTKSPINRSLFETWAFIMGRYTDEEFVRLCENRRAFMQEYARVLNNPDFELAISRHAMNHPDLRRRFQTLIDLTDKYAK